MTEQAQQATEVVKMNIAKFVHDQVQANANLTPAMTQLESMEIEDQEELEAKRFIHDAFDAGYVSGMNDIIAYLNTLDIEVDVTVPVQVTEE